MKLKYRKAVFIVAYARQKVKSSKRGRFKAKPLATSSKRGQSKTKKGIEYLILKRKLHWKGWEFPKGKIEEGESKINTAKRELKEETGHSFLRIKKFNFSGKYNYDKVLPDRPGIKGQTFSLYAAQIKKGKVSLDKKEHNGYKWVNFKKALRMLKWPNQKKSLRIVNSWLIKGR